MTVSELPCGLSDRQSLRIQAARHDRADFIGTESLLPSRPDPIRHRQQLHGDPLDDVHRRRLARMRILVTRRTRVSTQIELPPGIIKYLDGFYYFEVPISRVFVVYSLPSLVIRKHR